MPDDLEPRLTRAIGDAFRLERELGGGGMSRVFLATERALERQVVIKVLDLEGAVDASAERFRREIKVIAQLQHPHIVSILTAGGDGTLLWYAMPFVRGESLRARLVREGALPVQDAVGIVREMLDALATAHARGIVHRDIKPENILLEGRHAVVADFGVAKALADAGVNAGLTTAGVALGTPSYMAPEQALGEATTNHRADLYAVGAVLYEMLVGAPPFAGSLQAIIAAHLTAPVPSVRERRGDVPAVLQQLIERLMAKQPAERLQSAQEALTALESVTTPGGSPVSYASVAQELRASPSGTGASAAAVTTPVRGRKMPLATVAVVAVGLAVAGAWWLNTKRESGPLAAGADFIAVMPLGSTGDSTLARLGRDLVVTVSATLDGVGEVRTVDAMSVLAGTSNEANPIGLETAREIGRRLGAASVVHGSLVPEGDLVRADVGLYPTAGGDAIARLSVRAAASVAGGLTDSLASGLLRQIWRRGTPPSSLLSDVTTASTEALRLFLEGERYFETFDTELAVATYKRATAIDSNFAQAWLRISQVRGSAPGGSDTVANRRVSELADRLPVRERELLQLQDTPMPIPERFAAYTAFAQRYPEHYMAQYRAGDIPIHTGPRYGIPVEAARPYIDRLDVLAPKHYDNAQHRYFLAFVVGDTAQIIKATRDMAARGTGEFTGWAQALAGLSDRYEATGERATSEQLVAFLGTLTPIMRMSRSLTQWSLLVPAPFTTTAMWSEAVATIRRDPTLREFHEPAGVAEAVIRFGRGEVNGGVEDLLAINRPGLRPALLTSGVRNASYAVWFGFAEPSLLDKAIAQTRPFTQNLPLDQRYEVEWGEGIAAIVTKDSLRFMRALQTVSDTAEQVERVINRSLRALWRERHTGAADSLRALEDGLIREGGVFLSALPIHRAAIGRTLMREGDAEHAAFYLRWSDGLSFEERMILIEAATEGLLSFERGRVAEALGDSRAAALHYSRFLMNVDRPPAAVAAQMADARTRLDALIAARK